MGPGTGYPLGGAGYPRADGGEGSLRCPRARSWWAACLSPSSSSSSPSSSSPHTPPVVPRASRVRGDDAASYGIRMNTAACETTPRIRLPAPTAVGEGGGVRERRSDHEAFTRISYHDSDLPYGATGWMRTGPLVNVPWVITRATPPARSGASSSMADSSGVPSMAPVSWVPWTVRSRW